MANFFSKLFGRGKVDQGVEGLLAEAIEGIIEKGNFDLTYEIEKQDDGVLVNFSGGDTQLLTERDGMVLDGFQIYLKRLLQNKLSNQPVELTVDCEGYLAAAAQDLRDLADKLKQLTLDKGQASYVRALPPRDRKTVHRHLAGDDRIKSQSIGEGFCKKIKITPANAKSNFNNRQPRSQRGAEDNEGL